MRAEGTLKSYQDMENSKSRLTECEIPQETLSCKFKQSEYQMDSSGLLVLSCCFLMVQLQSKVTGLDGPQV